MTVLNNEKDNNDDYLPWTTSAANVNKGYPVFDYPITVKYKYEDEDDSEYRTDSSIARTSASAAAGDSVKVNISDSETLVSMRGGVHSPVDIGAYTNTEYANDSIVQFTDEDTFTMPAFDTTIYVTLKKNEEWISALVYDFPQETINNVTYDKIMLATGSDEASGITFEATITGDIIYAPTATEYRRNGSIVADTYYDEATGDYGEDTHQAKLNVKEYFGKDYLSTVTFLVPAGETTTIEFNPTDGTNDGIRYRWSAGEKEYLTPVSDGNGGE